MTVELVQYGLATNPFPLQPSMSVTNWAGRPDQLETLTDIVVSPQSTDIGASEFVIIHGDYGTGKSHALRYLTTLINSEVGDFNAISIYVPTVKLDQRTSFLRLYKEVIASIGKERLSKFADEFKGKFEQQKGVVRGQLSRQELEDLLNDEGSDEKLSNRVLEDVEDVDRSMARLMLELSNDNARAFPHLLGDSDTLPSIGRDSRINSDFAAARSLGSLLRVLTLEMGEQSPVCNAAYVFLDEVETVLEDRPADQLQFFQGIRELVNELPYNFCMLMAFSADAALLEAVIPQAVLQRMTRNYLELPILTAEDAKEFIANQIAHHRPSGFTTSNRFHPFTEAAIEVCLERAIDITPRHLFRMLHTVLVRAIRRDGLEPGQEIPHDLADSILTSGGF